jgi:hypothetical protein
MKSCHFQREVIMYTDKAKKLADTAVQEQAAVATLCFGEKDGGDKAVKDGVIRIWYHLSL